MSGRRRLLIVITVGAFLATTLTLASAPTPVSAEADAKWRYVDLVVKGFSKPVVGYFNADNKEDIIWYNPGPATDAIWYGTSQPGVFLKRALTIGGDSAARPFYPIVGDFAGNQYSDIYWYCPGTCTDWFWLSGYSSSGWGKFGGTGAQQDGYFYEETIETYDQNKAPQPGAYVLKDKRGGKDDIFWYYGVNLVSGADGSEYLWHMNDGFTLGYTEFELNLPESYLPVVGDFSGPAGIDDIWFYAPGAREDVEWEFAIDGSMTPYGWNDTPTGKYTPATIRRNKPRMYGDRARLSYDALLWYERPTCGGGSTSIWHFSGGDSASGRKPTMPPRTGQCRGDDPVPYTLDGSNSVVLRRAHPVAGRGKDFDAQVFDTATRSYGEWLTPGSRNINTAADRKPIRLFSGDFNGDRKPDLFWQTAGSSRDQIWYGRR